ncbi:response regulator [Xanthobacter autotrophicus]|uniref:response regulator n=1 Tax=Xanthobacter autotrophicus TaxID=280 RepID=UPI0024A70594|nr:response regulator [Xanthobacter autotrophicus]MDI4656790.1 response regulator [Xanthobacter autotrophicus]
MAGQSTGGETGWRIVVVDDEEALRETVAEYLSGQGFRVRSAASGRALDTLLAAEPADLILLDVHMPEEDGLTLARRIRAAGATPIIMLTAADDIVDRVAGLEVGADDYVLKPFDLRELKARIRAVLRRYTAAPPTQPPAANGATPAPADLVPCGVVFLDMQAHCLVKRDGTREMLTAMEFDLLRVFLQNPNRVLTRDRLLDLAHDRDNEPFDRSIDVRVTRLRKKIEADPAKPQAIKTVRGVGYLFVPGPRGP